MRQIALWMAALLAAPVLRAASDDLPARARAGLEKSTAYLRSISTEGGYLWRYSPDLTERAGENIATATQVWIQPPGTPSVGMAFLRAWEATRDARHLEAARAAATALAKGQLESGGWDYLIEFDPLAGAKWFRRSDAGKMPRTGSSSRRNLSTFDDDNTQSALRFLLAFCDAVKGSKDARDAAIVQARDYGLAKMIEAQYPNGAWPQRYDGTPKRTEDFPVLKASYPKDYPRVWSNADYKNLYTLNDNTHRDCIATMLDAHRRLGERKFLEAALRGGRFLLLAQMPEPQPVWAQQYNARMEPAWARAFEPPCVTGAESVGALRILMDLHIESGEKRFLEPFPAALAWYERSSVAPGRWARYYELRTNRQLFGDRDGKLHYRLEDISPERQSGYSWRGDYGVRRMMADYEKLVRAGREAILREREIAAQPRAAKPGTSKVARVREILAAQDALGCWIVRGEPGRGWKSPERVEMSVFIKNMDVLSDYLRLAQ